MALEAPVTGEGQLTIPEEVRNRLGIEPGDTILLRFDGESGVRLVTVPANPMERLDAAAERSTSLDLDATELIERERDHWNRLQ